MERSTGRPRPEIRSARVAMMPSAVAAGKAVSRMIRMPAPGKGSRLRWSAKGSSLASVVVMRSPGELISINGKRLEFPEVYLNSIKTERSST